MYAITDITGKVGGELARNLLAAGQRVRAIVRNASKGEEVVADCVAVCPFGGSLRMRLNDGRRLRPHIELPQRPLGRDATLYQRRRAGCGAAGRSQRDPEASQRIGRWGQLSRRVDRSTKA
jgi:nucleoside-diphosphate-sugar epimerase